MGRRFGQNARIEKDKILVTASRFAGYSLFILQPFPMAAAPLTSPLPAPQTVAPRRRNASTWARLRRHPLFLIGAAILVALLFMAVFAGAIGHDTPRHIENGVATTAPDPGFIYPDGVNELGSPHAPGGGFLMGADTLGRDVWTRVVYGARLSLLVAFCAMITSTIIGTTIGLLGGFYGGWVDAALTRFTEIVSALPTILLAITLAVVLPDRLPDAAFFVWLGDHPELTTIRLPGVAPFPWISSNPDLNTLKLLLAIGLVTWVSIARAVRGQTLALREREFIEAARALGLSNFAILRRHLLPNVVPTVVTLATLATAQNILLEAGLSYLGLGRPEQASWGGLIADGQSYLLVAPWIAVAPGVTIVLAVVAFNLIGNALGEVWETRR